MILCVLVPVNVIHVSAIILRHAHFVQSLNFIDIDQGLRAFHKTGFTT